MLRKFSVVLSLIFFSFILNAQVVPLNGKVINSRNEAIAGATIKIEGSSLSVPADVEGRFTIQLSTGKKYSLSISSAGYSTKNIDELEVKQGIDNNLVIVLENNEALEAVVIRSSPRKESTAALVNIQRNNPSVSSVIAADFISRTPDKNTGEILKRVSGTSIQDNKFVIVRGLGDRYNTAFLNGAQLPSSEPDKKAFSFDVIPSSVVENIVVNKTATPDLTGEFAGGLVQVSTRDVPNRNFLSVGAGIGYNTVSTGKEFMSNKRGSTDWLGYQDGSRDLPKGFPSTRQAYNGLANQPNGLDQKLQLTKLFSNEGYAVEQSKAAPIQSYNIAWGNSKHFDNGGKLGTVLSVVYRKQMLNYKVNRSLYETDGIAIQDYTDDQNKYSVNVGAMANIAYVKGNHKISFKNLFNQFFEDNFYYRSGPNKDRAGDINLWSSVLNQRTFYTGILEGNHQLKLGKAKVYWNAAYSLNDKSQPDLRTSAYFRSGIGSSNAFEWDQDDSRRFYSSLKDHGYSGSIAVTVPFEAFGEKQQVKFGGSTLIKLRDFNSRIFRYVEATNEFDNALRTAPYDQIFSTNNISRNGFVMEEFTNNQDKYKAVSALNGGYAMMDNKLSDQLRIIWGARVEYFGQYLSTRDLSSNKIKIFNDDIHVLPSVNFSYELDNEDIIRISASKTLSRPEFREIAPFQFFDYESTFGIRGNPDLVTTSIYNFDARYELYSGPGEAITFGGFYKRFINPIEFRLDPGSVLTRRNYFYQNAKDANTYGLEFEIRKNLDFLNSSNALIKDLSVFANLTYIFSQVSFNDELLGKIVSADRPVQGQSPYLINGGLQYSNSKKGWNGTLLYNRVGNRLSLVGYNSLGFPDIYENARDVIDLQVSKKILKKKGELKLTVSDLLNQNVMYYENVDQSRNYKSKSDREFSSYSPGSTITLGFTYNFNL